MKVSRVQRRNQRMERRQPPVRTNQEHLKPIAKPDHSDKRHDAPLQPLVPRKVQRQNQEHPHSSHQRRTKQRPRPRPPMRQHRRPKQQIKPKRRTQKLSQVSSDRRNLRRHPQKQRHRPRKMFPAVLRQRQPGHNPQLRRKILNQNGHRIRPQQYPQQPIPVLAPPQNIGREVARIDIGHRRHKRRAEVGPHLVPAEPWP